MMGSKLARILLVSALLCSPAIAGDWTHWRGPARNGTSPETGLIESWSPEGDNLLWRVDFTGRSTPLVLGDRVCANGRVGEGIHRQEVVACFDTDTGEQLWQRRFNVYHTTVPWTRQSSSPRQPGGRPAVGRPQRPTAGQSVRS